MAVNIIGLLWDQLRGGACRVASADTAVRTSIRGIRRPDATVECAPIDPKSYEADAPKLVVEVLAPSRRLVDRIRKVEEYKRLPTLTAIMLVEPGIAHVLVLRRDGPAAWRDETYVGLDAVVPLADLAAALALRDVYEGVPLEDVA